MNNFALQMDAVVIYGGMGALGGACVSHFLEKWRVISIDIVANPEAHCSIVVDTKDSNAVTVTKARAPCPRPGRRVPIAPAFHVRLPWASPAALTFFASPTSSS